MNTADNQNDFTLRTQNISAWYGEAQILKNISLGVRKHEITAIIGPSGCGKSTLIRCFNRMNDFIPGFRVTGKILFGNRDIYGASVDPVEIRMNIGMVFQKQNPFPKSIFENVTYGPRILGVRNKVELETIAERSLKHAALWGEVKDKLRANALTLSGGQQQRLCIARALAMEPEVLLLDEPCSALDPIATAKIEELMQQLKESYTLLIVTHNMQQAARVSDYTAYLYMGSLVEYGLTTKIFTTPDRKETEEYITGRLG